jgi:hypothetical protein
VYFESGMEASPYSLLMLFKVRERRLNSRCYVDTAEAEVADTTGVFAQMCKSDLDPQPLKG